MKKILVISLLFMMSTILHVNASTIVACVGNSITAGYGLSSAYTQAYPAILQDSLGSSYSVTNWGWSSMTMFKPSRTDNDSYWNKSYFISAMSSSPNTVFIELGTNDSKTYYWNSFKDSFETDYISMIDTFSHLTSKPSIWICMQPPVDKANWNMFDTIIRNQVNPRIREVALTKGVNLIDLYNLLVPGEWFWFSDSCHPNATGAIVMASYIYHLMKADTCKITQSGTTLSAATAYAYQWYLNDTAITSATGKTLTISKKGIYKVSRRINSSDSSRLVDTITVTSTPVGISANMSSAAASPVSIDFLDNMLRVTMKGMTSKEFTVSITDLKGAEIFRVKALGNASDIAFIPIPAARIRSGAYMYRISEQSTDICGKLLINR
jgi:lysophospholipase L1-like esterase